MNSMGSGTNIARGIPCGRQARFGSLTSVSAFLNLSSAHGVNGGADPFGKRAGWNWSIIQTPVRSGVAAGLDGFAACGKIAGAANRSAAAAAAHVFQRFLSMALLDRSLIDP